MNSFFDSFFSLFNSVSTLDSYWSFLGTIGMVDSHTNTGFNLDVIHSYAMAIVVGVFFFVFSLLLFYLLSRYVFNNFVENKVLEFIWTSFPGGILVSLMIPSITGLYAFNYHRVKKVGMNTVVSGRQWYWSYKFLPRITKLNTCSDCLYYFGKANKAHFFFNSGSNSSNVLMPFWTKKVHAAFKNNDYWVSNIGIVDGFHVPKTLYNILYSFRHTHSMEAVNKWIGSHPQSMTHRPFTINRSSIVANIPESEYKDLYWWKIFWKAEPLVRKVQMLYEVDSFSSKEDKIGSLRNLDADNPLLVPVNKLIRFFFWSSDVIHSFAVPDLGIKLDCVPGRLNSAYTLLRHVGKFYGQCSELCGANHSFMPSCIESYILSGSFCFGKHYYFDRDYWWDQGMFRQWTPVRVVGSFVGFALFKFFAFFGITYNLTWAEATPATLCPICVWLRNYFYSLFA
nr:cytochrome c oxidase subunit II [Platydemus manokwari]